MRTRTGGDLLVLAAITAAGHSARMGVPKPLVAWNGGTFLGTILHTLRAAGILRPAVVVAPGAEAVRIEALRAGGFPLVNPHADRGRFTSVRLAARWALTRAGHATRPLALVLWPVDCPAVATETVAALAGAARRRPGADVVPVYRGRGGHPVVLGRPTLERLASAPDRGHLRELMRSGGRTPVRLEVLDRAVLDNLNRPGDVRRALEGREVADARAS
ncbi:MAG: hypothetical protein D6718_10850 [Acidobacteria bacterium]|nr:MAG: hypothetical protein D6718_10850 [Acidobacteriota bacterium]